MQMTKNQEDLRVIRTKMNIKKAFMDLIKKKPVHKIMVTELAREAMINKGTFYLHYADIPTLYKAIIIDYTEKGLEKIDFQLLINDPNAFLEQFFQVFSQEEVKSSFPEIGPTTFNSQLPLLMEEKFRSCIYEANDLEKTIENNMKLDCLYSSLYCLTVQYHGTHKDISNKIFHDLVVSLFH